MRVPAPQVLTASAGLAADGSELVLKVVNRAEHPIRASVRLDNAPAIAPEGAVTLLTALSLDDENALDNPLRVAPATKPVAGLGNAFDYTFEANSLTIVRAPAERR